MPPSDVKIKAISSSFAISQNKAQIENRAIHSHGFIIRDLNEKMRHLDVLS